MGLRLIGFPIMWLLFSHRVVCFIVQYLRGIAGVTSSITIGLRGIFCVCLVLVAIKVAGYRALFPVCGIHFCVVVSMPPTWCLLDYVKIRVPYCYFILLLHSELGIGCYILVRSSGLLGSSSQERSRLPMMVISELSPLMFIPGSQH